MKISLLSVAGIALAAAAGAFFMTYDPDRAECQKLLRARPYQHTVVVGQDPQHRRGECLSRYPDLDNPYGAEAEKPAR